LRAARQLLGACRVPSLEHEAPLAVMRSDPAVVPALIHEALGLTLPPFAFVEEASADFTQVLPTQFRADLVVHLRGDPPEHRIIMGIVVEVQRASDPDKRRSWPLYVAALHAELDTPTCLVVLATDEATARWCAQPITTLQPGSVFIPLVVGPSDVPRIDGGRALREPALAVLSTLIHGNAPGGIDIARGALKGIEELPIDRANVFLDLIRAALDDVVWRALENEMDYASYKWKSDFYRKDIDNARNEGREEGREEGRLSELRRMVQHIAQARIGDLDAPIQRRIDACEDADRLEKLVLALSTAGDPVAVEKLLHDF
jgi:hypothetical protein